MGMVPSALIRNLSFEFVSNFAIRVSSFLFIRKFRVLANSPGRAGVKLRRRSGGHRRTRFARGAAREQVDDPQLAGQFGASGRTTSGRAWLFVRAESLTGRVLRFQFRVPFVDRTYVTFLFFVKF